MLTFNATTACCSGLYVEEVNPATKKLYIRATEKHKGSYTCSAVLEGNRQSKTVQIDIFREFDQYCPKLSHCAMLLFTADICACTYLVYNKVAQPHSWVTADIRRIVKWLAKTPLNTINNTYTANYSLSVLLVLEVVFSGPYFQYHLVDRTEPVGIKIQHLSVGLRHE